MKKSVSIAHIVNPCAVPETSDLYTAQPITFETMRLAKANATKEIDVKLYATGYKEDRSIMPSNFIYCGDLSSSCHDLNIDTTKKLPLISEIINKVYIASDAEFLVYTNVDIGLYPNFYERLNSIIKEGYDAFSITRRTLLEQYKSIDQIPTIHRQHGYPHPGWDCFVFKRGLADKFILNNIFIGAPGIGRALLCNLATFSEKFDCFYDEIITFHIGDDGSWKKTGLQLGKNPLNDINRLKTAEAIKMLIKSTNSPNRKNILFFHYFELLKVLHPRFCFPLKLCRKIIKIYYQLHRGFNS